MDESKRSQELESRLGTGTVDLGVRFEHHHRIVPVQGPLQSLEDRQLQSLDVDLDQAEARNTERLDHLIPNPDLELRAILRRCRFPGDNELGCTQICKTRLPIGKPACLGSEAALK